MPQAKRPLSLQNYKGALFDLDGVLTNTARIHALSWKKMFDSFLEDLGHSENMAYEPLSIEKDYPRYIDGKPRYEGVRSFLNARGITLPEGKETDSPEQETVKSLGNRKNQIFQELLATTNLELYQNNIEKIRQWRKNGIRTAIISSSKNCSAILEKTRLNSLFDARVDGVTAERRGLKGKPNPDIYLEGAAKLGLNPSDCMVFEDAIPGIQAGINGGFGLVVGIATTNDKETLRKNGAHLAVDNLVTLDQHLTQPGYKPDKIANALNAGFLDRILVNSEPVLFLDYDGTLTPIVNNPEDAKIPDSTQRMLKTLAEYIPVAIISGRDINQVEKMVGIEDIYYAGSHGFEIDGPGGLHLELEKAKKILPHFEEAANYLRNQTKGLAGVQIERKRFAIAVHFRNVSPHLLPELKAIVEQITNHYQDLKLSQGKKIYELKPNLDWDKGKAMDWLIEKLNLNRPDILPIYLGDDLTDEDAFRNLIERGIGILVGDHGEKTFAQYHLHDTREVSKFLDILQSKLKPSHE